MNKKMNSLFLIMVFAISLVLVACGGSANDSGGETNSASEGETIKLSLGHVLRANSHFNVTATTFAEEVEKRSNGSMVIDVFPEGQLGDEAQMVASTRSGDTAFVITAMSPISNIVEEFNIFELPYLFDGFEQASEIIGGELGRGYFDLLPEYDLVGLGHQNALEFNVYANKPVHQVSDMEGLKIRIPPSQGYLLSYEALGSQPTPTEYSEIYVGLQQGTLDGGVTSPDNYILDKFIEVANYYSLTKTHQQNSVLVASKEIMDSLTPEQQEIIWEASEVALKAGKDHYKKIYYEFLEEAANDGAEIIEPEIDGFKDAVQDVYSKLLQEIPNGQELFDELQEAIENS